jgi:thiosulfate/3-mercaptopyruvate sulfurtransferase
VDRAWLDAFEGPVVLADVRWYLDGRSGHDAYLAGHLPGARFVDLDAWLAGPASPAEGRHPLPDPEVFAEGLRRLGVRGGGPDPTPVVAYDDGGGATAARLVWLLRVLDHPAALLDGGTTAWDGDLAVGPEPEPARGQFVARPWPRERLVDLGDLGAPGTVLLDARNAERYRGEAEPVDPRAGHVPGARNLPYGSILQPDGRLLPADELRRRFESVGVTAGEDVVSYCGSGVTACHNLLVLEHAGLGRGRLYAGSWSQYSHTTLPAETGSGDSDRSAP